MVKYVESYEQLDANVKNKIGQVSIEPGDSLTDEVIQDKVGTMVTGSTQTGITVTYQDSTADIDFEVDVASDSVLGIASFDVTDFTVTSGDVTINAERVSDLVGGMVTGNTETGIAVSYQDGDNTLDFVVDATIVAAPTRLDALEEYNEHVADAAVTPLQGVALLTKAGVGAYTLALPAAGDDGKQLIISNGTANAHVVTLPSENLFDGTGTPKDTITFDAQIGASIHLVAINETWHMVGANDTVTLSDAV